MGVAYDSEFSFIPIASPSILMAIFARRKFWSESQKDTSSWCISLGHLVVAAAFPALSLLQMNVEYLPPSTTGKGVRLDQRRH